MKLLVQFANQPFGLVPHVHRFGYQLAQCAEAIFHGCEYEQLATIVQARAQRFMTVLRQNRRRRDPVMPVPDIPSAELPGCSSTTFGTAPVT